MEDLSSLNSFGLHVNARNVVRIHNLGDLRSAPSDHALILGRGSDILLTDDFDGNVLVNCITDTKIEEENDYFKIRCGGGRELDSLISELVSRSISGLENLSAIPGTVGAAPVQNVGAYGVEIGDFISSVDYFDLDRREFGSLSSQDCHFGYRTSFFKEHPEHRLFITEVEFHLEKGFHPRLSYKGLVDPSLDSPYKIRERVIKLRREKLPDPAVIGNAGSFFKNPVVSEDMAARIQRSYPDVPMYPLENGRVKLAAGWLIDRAGCRGITHGNAGTWEKQALVIVNRGNAKPHEIVALAKYVQTEVFRHFGIRLEPEVRIYGRKGEITWDQI